MNRSGYFLAALFGFLLTAAPLFAQTVVATIPVGQRPQAIALAPDGKRAYVGNSASDTVSVIDLTERKAIATVNVGRAVRGVAVTPDGERIFAANSGANGISVIDGASHKVIATISGMLRPLGLTMEPEGRHEWAKTSRLYVSQSGGRSVSVVDTKSLEVRDTLGVGVNPFMAAVSPDLKTLYVSNTFSGEVSIIDVTREMGAMANGSVGTIPVGLAPQGIAVTPDGKKILVNNSGDLSVTVIDAQKRAVIATIPFLTEGQKAKLERNDEGIFSMAGLQITPDSRWALSTVGVLDVVAVIYLPTLRLADLIRVGREPSGIAISLDGKFAYVANSGANDVSVIELGEKFQEEKEEDLPPPGSAGSGPKALR